MRVVFTWFGRVYWGLIWVWGVTETWRDGVDFQNVFFIGVQFIF